MIRFLPLSLPLVACVLACQEPTAPPLEALPASDAELGVVQPVILAEYDQEQTEVSIRLDSNELELGAYQGRFRFDPAELHLVDFSMPEDGYRVANVLGADDGEVRFAGFSIEPFENATAVTLVFRNRSLIGERTLLSVDLDVLGDAEGVVVPKRMIRTPERQLKKVVRR